MFPFNNGLENYHRKLGVRGISSVMVILSEYLSKTNHKDLIQHRYKMKDCRPEKEEGILDLYS